MHKRGVSKCVPKGGAKQGKRLRSFPDEAVVLSLNGFERGSDSRKQGARHAFPLGFAFKGV